MNLPKKNIVLSFLFFAIAFAAKAQTISLNGDWSFCIDPLQKGEAFSWHQPWAIKDTNANLLVDGYDVVSVPHSYTLDSRYNIIGKAWYRKAFKLPASATDKEIRIRFEAVFNKARIFLNGKLVSLHEGGYTPFTVNITKFVKSSAINYLNVEVDNSWDEYSIPGSRFSENANSQVYPWYEYGGIIRDVNLLITDKIFVANQKIEAKPDLLSGTATVKVFTWVENKNQEDKIVTLALNINRRDTKDNTSKISLSKEVVLKAYSKQMILSEFNLKKEEVLLWDYDNPNLYDVKTTINKNEANLNSYDAYFGIREVKVVGTRLLLNGKPIRMAGANRQSDHPVYGSTEPIEVANEDMKLLRNGNMIFSRISHTPLSKYFYQWADEHGYLIIAEISNWQLSPVQMESQRIKDAYEAQMRELVESFWNSPSIIAYSTGNEYASWTPEGDEWTRYQMEKFKTYDTTRLLTFVALATATNPANLKVAHNSFRYCDFLNFNSYSGKEGLAKNIESLHNAFPNKPIFISETGVRADQVKDEADRIKHLEGVIEVMQSHDYAIGFSYWSFNDYLSRYSATNKNGYRPWGMVEANRAPKELYKAFQKKLSPVTVEVSKNKVTVIGNSKFPAYVLSNYNLKVIQSNKVIATMPLPIIELQKAVEIKIDQLTTNAKIRIENKDGFVVYSNE